MVWSLAPYFKKEIDINKAIKLALSHDLVEAYAGDIFLFSDSHLMTEKKKEEQQALLRIKTEFKDFPEMLESIDEFEERSSLEARFVLFCDRVTPLVD